MSKDKKESEYLNVSDDLFDARYGPEKVKSSFKALGKGLFNVGKFAKKEILPRVEEACAKMESERTKR
ncbi:hypothetical protein [Marinobacter sp. tcs-11]|jgi:hypothetical protein|uniref:hypothetical protein n=1 Tax=Marinobacter sp. tcs-11 TaxID=1742860 RepID=UPI00257AF8FE|nr:hypothetical protein [Marinobacter sp. tcs-11]|tara:strand:+ start:217 stop:420 length:204 start_codon:yes stop_codon:yes gene_type:complete